MTKRLAVAAATLALAAGLTACGSSGSGGNGASSQPPAGAASTAAPASSGGAASTGSTGTAAKAVTVEVKGFAFSPGNVSVAKGGTVTWKFEDNTKHNVDATNNKFKSKDIQTGSYKYTFNTAGTYDYICSIHQYMKGTVTVQ